MNSQPKYYTQKDTKIPTQKLLKELFLTIRFNSIEKVIKNFFLIKILKKIFF